MPSFPGNTGNDNISEGMAKQPDNQVKPDDQKAEEKPEEIKNDVVEDTSNEKIVLTAGDIAKGKTASKKKGKTKAVEIPEAEDTNTNK